MLTKDYLLWLFDYDRENGTLTWKNHWCKQTASRLIGKKAGNRAIRKGTYYTGVMIKRKQHYIHRLIWIIENDKDGDFIDHINGCSEDNRISNLRSVNNRTNCQNQKRHRDGHLVGAHFCKRDAIWYSRVYIKGSYQYLGSFNSELEAHHAYKEALK